jgi:hypothetical protein
MDETRTMPETGYDAGAVPPTAGDPYYETTPSSPSPRPRRTLRLVLAALVIAAVSAGVTAIALSGGDDDDSDSANEDNGATESASDSTEAPTTTALPSTTAAPATTAPPSTTAPAPAPGTSAFPPEATLEHGGHTFGVYLAISDDPEDPALTAARDKATEAGYLTTNYAYGSLGCDEGAPEALEASTDTMAVAVYFTEEAQANQAKTAFATIDQTVVGIVPVINYCLD